MKMPSRRRSAFTLVEVLVAVAVLGFIVLMLAQMTGMVNKASHDGIGRVDNFTKSRAMLDLIASDLEHAVIRPDLPIFQVGGQPNDPAQGGFNGGTYAPALFTAVPGVSGVSVRNLSFVTYDVASNPGSQGSDKIVLRRSDLPVPWTGGAALVPFQNGQDNKGLATSISAATAREVAPGVVGFQFSFRREDGKVYTSYTGYDPKATPSNRVVAVGITLAVLGDPVLKQLTVGQLTRLQQMFTAATPIGNSPITGVKPLWDARLTAAFYADYPKDMGTNLKIFERWVTPSQPF